jgi:putative hydrolase of the HAD superfamily
VTGSVAVVGLDGDDTLWHSEQLFVETQERFTQLLADHVDIAPDALEERLVAIERQNVGTFGYGVKGFTLSLIETALDVTGGALPGSAVQEILELGKVLLDHPVTLLDGVFEAVDALTDRYRVALITKGDLLHQESKVARSGLADLLWQIEIVSEKDEATYRRVLERHAVAPAGFVMVGNSVRSDVLPVLELGGRAVHIPYHVTWALEQAEHEPERHRFPVLGSMAELPGSIDELAAEPWPAP